MGRGGGMRHLATRDLRRGGRRTRVGARGRGRRAGEGGGATGECAGGDSRRQDSVQPSVHGLLISSCWVEPHRRPRTSGPCMNRQTGHTVARGAGCPSTPIAGRRCLSGGSRASRPPAREPSFRETTNRRHIGVGGANRSRRLDRPGCRAVLLTERRDRHTTLRPDDSFGHPHARDRIREETPER